MLRKILAILLCLTMTLTLAVPAAAKEEELPLEVILEVYSNRKGHIRVEGLYLDNVLYIDAPTVCELTGAFIHEDAGDSITFSLHSKGRLITVTPEDGGRLRETLSMFRTHTYNGDIPAIYYGGKIYTSATHLLRYMGAEVGFGKDETSVTHMTVQMSYTVMDLIVEFGENDGYAFSWAEAEGKFLQPEKMVALAALDTILLGYDANILAYGAPGHADKVGVDLYTDLLKEILRTEGAELTETGYSEVDFFGDASNVTAFSGNWIKEVLGWMDSPQMMSKVNSSLTTSLDGAGLLLNVGGDYLKTLDTAMQFANMSTNQQQLLDKTLNMLPAENEFCQLLPNLFTASEEVSAMISGEYNANEAAAWNSVYSLLINASTNAMNSVNPFALAWESLTSIAKMDPLVSDLLNDEKCITFAAECQNVQVIAQDLLSQDLNMLYSTNFYMGSDQAESVELQEYAKLDMILALKSALTARSLLMQTGWLTEAAQNTMQFQAVRTAKLLQKAQNAKPVVFNYIENRDEDITWIQHLAKYKMAYAQILRGALRGNTYYDKPTFQLVYVNDDETPELALCTGWYHGAGVKLYTYYDGKVIEIGSFGEYGCMTYAPKQNLMVHFYMGMGAVQENYYQWVDQKLETIGRFDKYLSEDFESYTYYVNNEEVTQEYFESTQQQAIAGYTFKDITISNGKELTEENIQKMLKNVKDFIELG